MPLSMFNLGPDDLILYIGVSENCFMINRKGKHCVSTQGYNNNAAPRGNSQKELAYTECLSYTPVLMTGLKGRHHYPRCGNWIRDILGSSVSNSKFYALLVGWYILTALFQIQKTEGHTI